MVVGLGKDRQSLPVVGLGKCRSGQQGSRLRAWKGLKSPFSLIFRRFLESEEFMCQVWNLARGWGWGGWVGFLEMGWAMDCEPPNIRWEALMMNNIRICLHFFPFFLLLEFRV